MDTDQTTETGASTETDAGEGTQQAQVETVAIPKSDYDKLNQTLGSLKRELKDLKKSNTQETQQTKTDDSALVQKLERITFRQAGITHQDDMDLARATAKKWGMDVDDVLNDEDFQAKLGKQQAKRANAEATSDIKGGQGQSQAKFSPEYWLKLGKYPSKEELPDRKARIKVLRAFEKKQGGDGIQFYND